MIVIILYAELPSMSCETFRAIIGAGGKRRNVSLITRSKNFIFLVSLHAIGRYFGSLDP